MEVKFVPEETIESKVQAIFSEIRAENFPDLMKNIDHQVQ